MAEKESNELIFYHPGKVVKTLKGTQNIDDKKKAVIEMWDNNIVTCETGKAKLSDGNFVIVEFRGVNQGGQVIMRAGRITDVLSDSEGETIWEHYKSFLNKAKPSHPLTG